MVEARHVGGSARGPQTGEAAEYPKALCAKYATLVVRAFKKTLQLEWWRSEVREKKEMVSQLQVRWLESKEKRLRQQQASSQSALGSKRVWSARLAETDVDPDRRVSKKAKRELENTRAIGGMRNPFFSVSRLGKVAEVGRDIARLWRRFAKENPEAMEVAKSYGSKDCQPNMKIAAAWKEELKLLLKARDENTIKLKENIEFVSPLDPSMWRAWQRASADPEKHIAEWAEAGAPLGMGKEIPSSGGVFPEVEVDTEGASDMPALEWQAKVKNYTSMFEDPEGASAELGKYLDKGFCKRMSKEQAAKRFDRGTISKLALITKQKSENVIKRRIIIDLLRSGGNARARVPERIILPRGTDVIKWKLKSERAGEVDPLDNIGDPTDDAEDPGIEIVRADLSDAYCHFPVAREELGNCLAPGLDEDEIIVFCAMLFGFKAAPLVMGRLSSALARLWQSMIMRDGSLQLYMDDPLFAVLGPLNRRRGIIAMLLYTAMAMGINLAFHKGERGLMVKWIGVAMELDVREACFMLSIPKKVAAEILEKLLAWKGKGMISLRDLRATTGKLSWVAGIVPRLRWAVSILYAVVADVEATESKGIEVERTMRRSDQRPKLGLVPVKRFELARSWLETVFQSSSQWLTRNEDLEEEHPEFMIVTDASPEGLGAVLAHVEPGTQTFEPIAALAIKVTEMDATELGLEWGKSSSQGPLEATAVAIAINTWADKLRGGPVLLKSDSVVALATARKLASSSPTMNCIGAYLAFFCEMTNIPRIVGHHVPGILNVEADWLSRPTKQSDTPMPGMLQGVKIRRKEAVDFAAISPCPLPGTHPEMWGGSSYQLHQVFECL